MNPQAFTYEDFSTQDEVDTFKRVKKRTMKLADAAREVCIELTGAVMGDGSRSDKHFLRTHHGTFRMAVSHASDNSTEHAAHARMGVTTVYMGESDSIIPWLRLHNVPTSWGMYVALVERELG